jgi:tetratricopeptide (TPR) repeat protein
MKARWVPVLAMAASVWSSQPALADGPQAASTAGANADEGLSSPELDRMLTPLGQDAIDERRAAATAVGSLGSEATAAIARKLAELRRGTDDGAFAVVKGFRERASKSAGFDLADALVALKPDAATRHALTVACLLRALAHAGTTVAVRQMVMVASDVGGAFRPELTRQMKLLSDRAVPALVEARRDPSPETRGWASGLLEAMGKRTPGDAVQTKDNQVVADVLRAYAGVKDLDALPVVLSFVNSDRVQVRTAAREAALAYGQDGIWKLKEAYAVLTGEPAPEGISAADLAKKLFDAYDRYRLRDVYALVDQGLAAQKSGKLEDAVAAFDGALARQPMLDRRAEMAPAYLLYGESLESSDRSTALAYLRKALRIDEGGPQSGEVRSEIHYLEGEDLLSHGIADTEPFEKALALDPQNARARAELDRLRVESESSRARGWRLVVAGAMIALSLVGILVFGGRRRT